MYWNIRFCSKFLNYSAGSVALFRYISGTTQKLGQQSGTTSLNPADQTVGEHKVGRQNTEQPKARRAVTPRAVWDEIRLVYDISRETLAEMALRFRVSVSAIQYRAKKEGWLPRRPRKGLFGLARKIF